MGNKEIKILEKYKSFFNDLTAGKIMNKMIIYLKEENKISEAKSIMKNEKISGIPIVDDSKNLINLVSTEDIITALERGIIDCEIKELGRKEIVAFNENENFEKILEFHARYAYGRYPVINNEGKLLGIITKHDLLYAVVSKLSVLYLHDERRREILDSPLSIYIKNNLKQNRPQFVYNINNNDVNSAGEGSAFLKNYLIENGVNKVLVRKISIATYEAEVNVVIHGGGIGKIVVNQTEDSIIVFVEDIGPGIENIEKALEPGFSTAPEYIRSLGFGAGMGLPNIKRFADKLVITSEKNNGVRVEMLFWINENK